MRRHLFGILFIILGVSIPLIARADLSAASASDGHEADVRPVHTRYVCVPSLMWRNPELCPSYGPGHTACGGAATRR
jgi:hypothetical protein